MNFVRKYCFTCRSTYDVDESHPHRCVMEDARREFTLEEIRTVIHEELAPLRALIPGYEYTLGDRVPRKACDGDIM